MQLYLVRKNNKKMSNNKVYFVQNIQKSFLSYLTLVLRGGQYSLATGAYTLAYLCKKIENNGKFKAYI